MSLFAQDVVFALRTLRRRAGFTVIAVLTLALGIGAATAIFTVVDGVLLRPLPFRSAGELVTVWQTDARHREQATLRRRWDRLWFTYPEFQQWRTDQRSFADVAVYGAQEMALTGLGDPTEVAVSTATASLLPLLGTRVSLGRWFLPGEEGPGTERLAVISHELWTGRFGSDPDVVDRFLTLDESRYRVVGVLPAGFRLPSLTSGSGAVAAVWIPIGSDGGGQQFDSSYEGIGRLKPGVPVDAAAAETDRIIRVATGQTERGARVVPRLEAETGGVRAPLLLLGGGVVLLLLIACANVTTLLLGEAPAREHEIATRKALGASMPRLVRQLLTESAVLSLMGGALGLALAWIGTRALVALAPATTPRLGEVTLDARALAFSFVAVVVATLAFGLAPALTVSRRDVTDVMRGGTRAAGVRGPRLLDAAIVAQIAMALVLLAGAGVLARSLQALWAVDTGFRSEGVLTLSVTLPQPRYAEPAAVRDYYDRVAERLAAIPGMRHVGATSNLPLTPRNQTTSIDVEGVTVVNPADRPNVQRRAVRRGFFPAMGIPLRAGRFWTDTTGDGASATEIVVDEAMARRTWPNASALGKRIRVFGAWFTVVGIVGDVRHGRVDESGQPTIYLSHARQSQREMTIVLATAGNPDDYMDAVRRATQSVDPTIPIVDFEPMTARVERSLSAERYRTTLLGAFGVAAAALTAVGIFAVIARAVSRRRREIAIRVALGSPGASIARVVAAHQGRSVAIGVALGLLGARLVAPVLGRFVYGVDPSDPLALIGAAGALLALAGIAACFPVCDAVRTDPGLVLREVQ